jgi:hypothetical protein
VAGGGPAESPRPSPVPAPAGVDTEAVRRIVREIDRVLRSVPVHSAPALTTLTQTLREHPERLANRDLVATFPAETLLPIQRRGWDGFLLLLRLVRDAFVFVPVLTTWHGLKAAVDAHAAYKDRHPNESFLSGWEDGFGGKSGTLAQTAGYVVAWIITLIVLTVVIGLIEGWLERREERAYDDLDGQLALASLALALPPPPATEPIPIERSNQLITSIGAAATRLSDALDRAGNQIGDTMAVDPGTAIGQALSSWIAAAEGLTALGEGLRTPAAAVSELAALRRGFADDQLAWREQSNHLIRQLQDATNASVTEAVQHQAVADHVLTISRQVGEEVRLVGEALEGLRDRWELVDGVMERLRGVMEWLQDRLSDGAQAAAPPPRRPVDSYGAPGFGTGGYGPSEPPDSWSNPLPPRPAAGPFDPAPPGHSHPNGPGPGRPAEPDDPNPMDLP